MVKYLSRSRRGHQQSLIFKFSDSPPRHGDRCYAKKAEKLLESDGFRVMYDVLITGRLFPLVACSGTEDVKECEINEVEDIEPGASTHREQKK